MQFIDFYINLISRRLKYTVQFKQLRSGLFGSLGPGSGHSVSLSCELSCCIWFGPCCTFPLLDPLVPVVPFAPWVVQATPAGPGSAAAVLSLWSVLVLSESESFYCPLLQLLAGSPWLLSGWFWCCFCCKSLDCCWYLCFSGSVECVVLCCVRLLCGSLLCY